MTDETKQIVEVTPHPDGVHVDLWYPSNDNSNPPRVHVGLMHVRAAMDISVEYDFDRDGYVIRMDKTRDFPNGGGCEVIEEAVEVAFIPAWLEEEP